LKDMMAFSAKQPKFTVNAASHSGKVYYFILKCYRLDW